MEGLQWLAGCWLLLASGVAGCSSRAIVSLPGRPFTCVGYDIERDYECCQQILLLTYGALSLDNWITGIGHPANEALPGMVT